MPPDLRRELIATELPVAAEDGLYRPASSPGASEGQSGVELAADDEPAGVPKSNGRRSAYVAVGAASALLIGAIVLGLRSGPKQPSGADQDAEATPPGQVIATSLQPSAPATEAARGTAEQASADVPNIAPTTPEQTEPSRPARPTSNPGVPQVRNAAPAPVAAPASVDQKKSSPPPRTREEGDERWFKIRD
jgi:hypothetical protein